MLVENPPRDRLISRTVAITIIWIFHDVRFETNLKMNVDRLDGKRCLGDRYHQVFLLKLVVDYFHQVMGMRITRWCREYTRAGDHWPPLVAKFGKGLDSSTIMQQCAEKLNTWSVVKKRMMRMKMATAFSRFARCPYMARGLCSLLGAREAWLWQVSSLLPNHITHNVAYHITHIVA